MKKVLVVTHSKFAVGIISSLNLIVFDNITNVINIWLSGYGILILNYYIFKQ